MAAPRVKVKQVHRNGMSGRGACAACGDDAAWSEEVRGIGALRLFDARSCEDYLARLRASRRWSPALVGDERPGGGYDVVEAPGERSASTFALGRRSRLRREFDRRVELVVKPLVNRVWQSALKSHGGTQLVRYLPGGFYLPHADTTHEADYRYFTVLCYLNDDFEGGHTVFPNLRHRVAPRAGKAVVFPSEYLHGAEPVRAGEKYVLVSWLTGPPPLRWL